MEYRSTKECLDIIRQKGHNAQEVVESLFKTNVFEVLEIIQAGECVCVGEINEEMDHVSQPQISHALGHLRRAGLVHRDRINKFKYYSVVPGSIARLNRIAAELADGYDASVTAMDLVEAV